MVTETQKSDRSSPPTILQTLSYGAEVTGGPTVKSLDDTTDSSIRGVSEREDMGQRVKEVSCHLSVIKLNYYTCFITQFLIGRLSQQDFINYHLYCHKLDKNQTL